MKMIRQPKVLQPDFWRRRHEHHSLWNGGRLMNDRRAAVRNRRVEKARLIVESIALVIGSLMILGAILFAVGLVRTEWLLHLLIGMGAALNLFLALRWILSELYLPAAAAFVLFLSSGGLLLFFLLE